MKLQLLTACLLAMLIGATPAYAQNVAAPPPPPASKFSYAPFPELPSTAVTQDNFLSALEDACDAFASLEPKTLQAPNVCADVEAERSSIADLLASARSLPATRPDTDCNAEQKTAQARVNALAQVASQLQTACGKLRKARPDDLDDADLEVLRDARDAPELLPAIKTWARGTTVQEASKGSQGKGASAVLPGAPSVGSLSDQLIRGMAEFLAKRAQQEALRYLRGKLKMELCDGMDDQAELRKAAFSNICTALTSLDDDMSLEAIGSFLRAAAERDLRKLPDLSLAYAEYLKPTAANATFAGRLGLRYFDAVRGGRDPFDVLYSLGELDLQSCEARDCKSMAGAVRLASAFAYALRQGGENWEQQFEPSVMTPQRRPVAGVALLLLVEKRLTQLDRRGSAVGFRPTKDVVNKLLLEPLGLVSDSFRMVKAWQALDDRLRGNLSEESRREVLAEAMEQGTETFTEMVESLDRLGHGSATPGVAEGARRARAFVAVGANLVRRNYGAAVVVSLEELKELVPEDAQPGSKYLPFIVEIASAQSSNDVAAAFDAYAAPLGTYELKYKRNMVTLNGMLGWTYSFERMDSQGLKGTAASTAAFAPIGIHLSHNLSGSFHLGGLLTVLDLGAVTALKTTDTQPEGDLAGAPEGTKPQVSDTPKLGFEQVFSPGAYLVLGLAGSPFVVGAGASLSPKLREVRQDTLKTDVSVLRYGGFLAIDIPILPFGADHR
jgi:hypothetical protein